MFGNNVMKLCLVTFLIFLNKIDQKPGQQVIVTNSLIMASGATYLSKCGLQFYPNLLLHRC